MTEKKPLHDWLAMLVALLMAALVILAAGYFTAVEDSVDNPDYYPTRTP